MGYNIEYFRNQISMFKLEAFDMKKAIILIQKLRLYYQITKDKNLYYLSVDFVKYCYDKNNLDARILLYKIYFLVMSEENDLTETMKLLKKINSGLRYYKANDIRLYLLIIYEKARIIDNKKQLEKYLKNLKQFSNEYSISYVYQADLMLDNGYSEEEVFLLLKVAVKLNGKSALLYECLYRYFKINKIEMCDFKILNSTIKWAIRKGFNIEDIVKTNIEVLSQNINIKFAIIIYDIVADDELLKAICEYFITNNNLENEAFEFYKTAMKKQMQINGLNKIFITASAYNGYENISNFYMKTYLSNNQIDSDIDSFIFHILLTKEHLAELVNTNKEKIELYIKNLIEKNCFNEYELSAFKYVILNQNEFNLTKEEIIFISKVIFENLFLYKIEMTHSKNECIVIIDTNKNYILKYDINNNKAIIKSASSEFSYYLYNKELDTITSKEIRVKPMIYSYDIDIYLYFYNNNFSSEELYIFLTNYYFDENASNINVKELFTKTLSISSLSQNFRRRINTYLAQINIVDNDFEKALINIDNISYTNISKGFLEKIVLVYCSIDNYKEVKRIIGQNFGNISNDTINLICSMIKSDVDKRLMADIFYKSLKNGNENQLIFETVVNYCDISFKEQLILLRRLNYDNYIFFNKIINNSLQKKYLDEQIEHIFYKVYNHYIEKQSLDSFIELLIYKVIQENYKISDLTIEILLKERKDNLSANNILFIFYNNFKTNDLESFNAVIESIENQNIIFETKNLMCKYFDKSTYFRKYKAFSYITKKYTKVNLWYKIDEQLKYSKIEMEYYKYGYYFAKIIMFYNESIEYYYEEERVNGSIQSEKYYFTQKNDLISMNKIDEFDLINDAIILQSKYLLNECEKNIENLIDIETINHI